jgi:hypothetical protein
MKLLTNPAISLGLLTAWHATEKPSFHTKSTPIVRLPRNDAHHIVQTLQPML